MAEAMEVDQIVPDLEVEGLEEEDTDELGLDDMYMGKPCCQDECLSRFPQAMIEEQLLGIFELTTEELDLILIGQIKAHRYS